MKTPVFFLIAAALALAPAARASVTENISHTYRLAADGTIHLDNVNGDIEIIAWDKPEVALEAEKKGRTDEDLKRVTLEINSSPAKLSIKTKYAKKSSWFSGSVNASVRYKLMVPAGVRLQKIDSVNSDITVTGVRGAVDLDTVNGSITATGLAADASLDSVNGSLSAEFASLVGVTKVKLDSVNGRASVTLPQGAGARIDADSVNGRVSVGQPIRLGKKGRHSLTGEIGTGGPEISIETVNGGIAVHER